MDVAPGTTGSSIIDRFHEVCERHADRIAVTHGTEHLTYAHLRRRADAMASQLASSGVHSGQFVALWLEKSPDLIAGILGVLQAGCAYLPLDAGYPIARVLETLEDAQPAALLTSRTLAASLPDIDLPLLYPDRNDTAAPQHKPAIPRDSLAYLLYTSGSTGKPKGVLVTHGNVLRLFEQTERLFHFTPDDTWTMFHSAAFDFSVWEIFGALLHGARLVLVPFETSRTPQDFLRLLATETVTVLNQTPTAFRLLLQAETEAPQPLTLRTVVFGGEALPPSLLRQWFQRHGDAHPSLYNMYGITETTVHVTCHRLTHADAEADALPLGQPIADLSLYLLDENQVPIADETIGELYIGGPGVARGYHQRPQLTAERFLPDPFRNDGTRMYRSGDLARRRNDGNLVYAGRADAQVKINGFRIEPGEVESALAACDGIRQSCVVARTGDDGQQRLLAYFVPTDPTTVNLPALASTLARQLPPQMLPSSLVPLAHLPLTPNGKLDVQALPEPPQQQATAPQQEASELETAVLALARDTVGAPTLQLADNFFAAGGESLMSMRFAMRVREAFGVRLTLRDLFEAETIAALAARIEQLIVEDLLSTTEEEAVRLSAAENA